MESTQAVSPNSTIPIMSRPAANCPVKILAALRMLAQPLLEFIEPDRSMTIMMTTSRREAVPIALMVVELILNHFMK